VTKAEQQRVRRHATIAVLARLTPEPQDDDSDRLEALGRWHGDDAEPLPAKQ